MNKLLSATAFGSMLTLAAAFVTGCSADAVDASGVADEPTESTATASEALAIGGGGGGLTSPSCTCKVHCASVYAGRPASIQVCEDLCDANNLCRKGLSAVDVGAATGVLVP